MKKTIVLNIGVTEFSFTVTTEDYNGYLNAVMPNNKVAPAHNLIMRTVAPEHKEELRKVLENSPGTELQLSSVLLGEFAPTIEITIKK